MKKGLFITFEGPDGSGKTTQIHKVAEWFKNKGYEVVLTREPGGTKAAEAIRQIVLDPGFPIKAECETLLYLAARAEHVEKVVLPALAEILAVSAITFKVRSGAKSNTKHSSFTRPLIIAGVCTRNMVCM